MKLKELLLNIDYNENTRILIFVDNEEGKNCYYKEVTKNILGFVHSEYDNYMILNIFMHLNTITICKD